MCANYVKILFTLQQSVKISWWSPAKSKKKGKKKKSKKEFLKWQKKKKNPDAV